MGIVLGERKPLSAIRVASDQVPELADEYFIAGFNKYIDPGIDVIAGKRDAIQQFTQAIQLSSNYGYAYFMRADSYAQVGEFQKSLVDYNQAISLQSNNVNAYNNRGNLKKDKLNDSQGALADYDQAIILKPDYALAYVNRGLLKAAKLNDSQGGLVDCNRAIQINPQLTNAYAARGLIKAAQLNDRPGGIADLRQAASLARAQGQTQLLQNILGVLSQLGVTE